MAAVTVESKLHQTSTSRDERLSSFYNRMTDPRSEGSVVRYFCTAGNGMEPFLMDEVKRKLAAKEVCQMPGKVLFSSSATIDRVSELKSAERLFLLLKQDSPLRLSAHTNPAKVASLLESRLLGDRNQWISAVKTWSRLQEELADSKTTVKTPNIALGVTRQREVQEKGLVEPKRSTGEQWHEKSERLRGVKQAGTQTLEKKRKWDNEEEEEERKDHMWDFKADNKMEKGKTSEEVETGMVEEFSNCRKNSKYGSEFNDRAAVCAQTTAGLAHTVESTSRTMGDMMIESAVGIRTTGERARAMLKACRTNPELPSCTLISFRVSCKCTGSLSRCFGSQEVSKVIGVGLSRLLGWKADLKNPQLEINVYLSDDHCLLGIPLTRCPLASRSYIKTTGLRSTVAWAMASLAQIQPGFSVVDPMCGVGTILIEAAQEHKAACFLGMDIDDGQLQKANENMAFAELGHRIHLLKASSMVLPLASTSVDAVICDLPFGRKFGTRTDMAANLPLLLTEMERVLCTGGTLVLLLSPQLSCLLKKLLIQKDPEPTSNQETKTQTGIQNCSLSPASPTKQQTFQIHPGVKSSHTQRTEPQTELQPTLLTTLSSLKHQATFRVSLGAIDGLIHKYVKTDA